MMKTPICDFVKNYKKVNPIRMHMPGHKGKSLLGFEDMDITEIDGADVLYHADGIIKESEANASFLFGCPTFYSAEGSSLAIRAMLALAKSISKSKIALAARNVHKTFITAAALLDFDVYFVEGEKSTYHSVNISAEDVEDALAKMDEKPFCVYLTSPDYLGNILDIKSIAKVCKKYMIPLLVDNAHGSYLKFIDNNLYPIDCGADMCADSAHKTLPTLTGGAYLHISENANPYFVEHAKQMMNLFSSTSPSYLILESLDMTNKFLYDNKNIYKDFVDKIKNIKEKLKNIGYTIIGNEPMKITIDAKEYGYSGNEINKYLKDENIYVEFYDNDFVVLMPTPNNSDSDLKKVYDSLSKIHKKDRINKKIFNNFDHQKALSIREATFSENEMVKVEDACGLILADTAVVCPPAIPILVSGEVISLENIKVFKYYGINHIFVVKKYDKM